jgi:uncharacterized RDD family membrane protein YckC
MNINSLNYSGLINRRASERKIYCSSTDLSKVISLQFIYCMFCVYRLIVNKMTSRTLRFINFLTDSTIYLAFVLIFFLSFRNVIAKENVKWISILVYFLYYFLFEYFTGQTIGKIVTKSKVISLTTDNNYFFFRIGVRTIMRFIPIDILSYLFTENGLHDWISKTKVIKL